MAFYCGGNGLTVDGKQLAEGVSTVTSTATFAGVEVRAEDERGRVVWRGRDAVVSISKCGAVEVKTCPT